MFNNCYNLIGEKGTTYDSNHIDAAYARIDADGVPGYFTGGVLGIKDLYFSDYRKNGLWFKINGVRLEGKPTHEGIYLHEGKKVYVK